MEIKRFFTPNRQGILFLLTCMVAGSWTWLQQDFLSMTIYFFGTLVFAWSWSWVLSRRWDRPAVRETDMISAIIILLILMPPVADLAQYNILWVFASIFFALTWKRFVRWKMSPVLNPAGLALLGTVFLSGQGLFLSWWGTSFHGYLSLGMMLVWLIFRLKLWRKQWMAWTFIVGSIVFSALYCWWKQHMPVLDMLLYMTKNSTMMFFAVWMLVEPKTSPMLVKQQVFVALLASASYWFLVDYAVNNSLLWTLLLANVLNFILKVSHSKKV